MPKVLEKVQGLTLIELMAALAVSAILISALYQVFIGQQRTYIVQEQVVDMRQNVRAAIGKMIREIRMAGFGRMEMVLPITFGSGKSAVTYSHVVNSNQPSTGLITIVTAVDSSTRGATLSQDSSGTILTVSDVSHFDIGTKRYVSLGGIESNTVINVNKDTNVLTLKEKPIYRHQKGTHIYPIRAISYKIKEGKLYRDENVSGTNQPMTEGNAIESIQYEYLDAEGIPTEDDGSVRMIGIKVTAKTDEPDPHLKSGDGHRRRQISSRIQLRNLETSP